MKLVGASLIAFALSVEAAHQVDPKWIQKKNKALRILNSRRKARDNNDLFEEIQKGDLKRECVEEKCDYEELRETFEDDGKADEWWSRAVRKCTTDPEDQKCDKQHTAKCINQWQKKTCQCKQGWNGDLCKEDVDECSNREVAQTCGEKTCINTEGSFRCGCEAGFTLQADFSCKDDDECAVDNAGCQHNCVNTEGSFECACNDGYVLSDDGASCIDIDECLNIDSCDTSVSQCVNNDGSFVCECNAGFSHGFGDTVSSTCEDINECESVDCPIGSVCENSVGSYTCKCPEGFNYQDGECVDVDECVANVCGDWDCRNTEGSYSCKCWIGYQQVEQSSRSDSSSGFLCEDVNECESGAHTCNADSEVCVNLDGNFECACNAGYEAIGETCQDLDECAAGLDNCEADEVCVNTPGSFTCMSHQMNSCELGHVWVGTPTEGACEDQDECATDNGGCFNAECENKIGSFECHCNTGFIDINGVCSDIDECSGDVCQFEGSMDCVNTLGSYQCTCQNGFKQNDDLLTCSDIDECADARIRTGCAENGEVCHNLPGGFECVAEVKTGCAVENKCDHQCNDKEDGSIFCSCWPGYVLSCDGHTCLKDFDVEIGAEDMLSQGNCPAGFVKLGGKYSAGCSACFFASMDKSDRDHAAQVCEGLGASLAVVDNKEQNFYLSELFSAEEQFWIGARWNDDEEDFFWDNGSMAKFTRWAKNEPSTVLSSENPGPDPEHCVVGNWGYPGHWNDLPCAYNEARYACSMMHKCDGAPQKVESDSHEEDIEDDDEEEEESDFNGDEDDEDYDANDDEYDAEYDYENDGFADDGESEEFYMN